MFKFAKTIRGKVFLMVLPPILVLTALATYQAFEKGGTVLRMKRLSEDSLWVDEVNRAVHSLQVERGASVMLLANPSPARKAVLDTIRREGVSNRKEFLITLGKASGSLDSTVVGKASKAGRALDLQDLQTRVDARTVSGPDAQNDFSRRIVDILSFQGSLLRVAGGAPLERRFQALSTLQALKDQASLEQATIGNAFASGAFPPQGYEQYLAQKAEQNALSSALMSMLDPLDTTSFQKLLIGPSQAEFDGFRLRAEQSSKGELALTDPDRWFKISLARLEALKSFESSLSAGLQEQAMGLRSQAILNLALVLGGTFALQLLLVAFAWALSRRITTPIEALATAMRRLSEGDLTQHLVVGHMDETGVMTEAFNEMSSRLRSVHAQMIRAYKELAKGAANLKTNADRMTVTTQQLAAGAQNQREFTDHMAGATFKLSVSTGQVRMQIEDALDQTSKLRTIAERGQGEAIRISGSGELLDRVFQTMLQIIQNIDLKTAEIHRATSDQDQCGQELEQKVEEVRSAAGEGLLGASQLANTAPEIAFTAGEILSLSERLAKTASIFQV
jgi:methyl-accepting chemotaxis protein